MKRHKQEQKKYAEQFAANSISTRTRSYNFALPQVNIATSGRNGSGTVQITASRQARRSRARRLRSRTARGRRSKSSRKRMASSAQRGRIHFVSNQTNSDVATANSLDLQAVFLRSSCPTERISGRRNAFPTHIIPRIVVST